MTDDCGNGMVTPAEMVVQDDIVTRLRRVPERVPKGGLTVGLNEYYQRCQDAADEIERLRKMLEEVARERDKWMGQAF